jgi:hypothetical protein
VPIVTGSKFEILVSRALFSTSERSANARHKVAKNRALRRT